MILLACKYENYVIRKLELNDKDTRKQSYKSKSNVQAIDSTTVYYLKQFYRTIFNFTELITIMFLLHHLLSNKMITFNIISFFTNAVRTQEY